MKIPLIIIFLSFFAISASGQLSAQESMVEKANQSYSAENYTLAVAQYDSVLQAGYESAGLYFNLGNAYFKLNNMPAAILNYEKAKKLDPTDKDIRFNLDLANSRIIDKIEPLPEFFLKTWWKALRDQLSSDQWAKVGLVAFIAALLSFALFVIISTVILRKFSFWIGVIFFIVMSFSFIFSYSSYHEYSKNLSGIIFTPTVTVKSSPNDNSVDLFVIHEGTKVDIIDQVEGWGEVRLANGSVGWVKTNTYQYI